MQTFPIKLDAQPLEAFLVMPHRSRQQLHPSSEGLISAPNVAAGVYRLFLRTECGCFESPVYVPCPPPAFSSDHPDNERHKQECCP